ncbi:MAG: ribonuclease R [Alphaproteobacteria bacterium]|nr:ribonuclease R [Alphaproteobacteria bacterium]
MAGSRQDRRGHGRLPSADELVAFLRDHPEAVGRREIARAFRLAAEDLPELQRMLRAVEGTGMAARAPNRKFIAGSALPDATVVEGCGADEDGIPLARPVQWPVPGPAPVFRLRDGALGTELPAGARAAARLIRQDNGEVEAELIGRLDHQGDRLVGVFRADRGAGRLVPADRRNRTEYRVASGDTGGAMDGELVLAEELAVRRFGSPQARIVERLGPADAPGAISRVAIASYDIPTEFPPAALAEAAVAEPVEAADRADLRGLALVTIDGSDARDFDDAVWAEPDDDPENPGGWHIVVAIADVAWYVRPGSALDNEARRRGNSVYFPDRVVPMLPEALSNELCSLQPGRDRACLAADLWIDAAGRKRRHRFRRAIMRSAARLTYDEVQAVQDGLLAAAPPVAAERFVALYGAFAALDQARRARGALELDLVEHRVVLDDSRRPIAIVPRPRLDSHRLIEEYMILANVAAAEELENRGRAFPYRVHDAPSPDKLAELHDFLVELGIPGLALAKGQAPRPELFNRILRRAAATPQAQLVNELVLRSQSQAVYSPRNLGHFGLALRRYAHFTSPIRRYADLLVHRALLGEPLAAGSLDEVAEHISMTERRATAAERAALDRYRAMLLAPELGAVFAARITGIAEFGVFVTLSQTGADGLVPVSTLPSDYYRRDASGRRLVGRGSGRVYTLGDSVSVRLHEADPVGGRLIFHIETDAQGAVPPDSPLPGRRHFPPQRRRRFPPQRRG